MVEGVPTTDLPRVWVGTAKAMVELSGFVARTTPMLGVHDDLRAHALAGEALVEAALVLLTD